MCVCVGGGLYFTCVHVYILPGNAAVGGERGCPLLVIHAILLS